MKLPSALLPILSGLLLTGCVTFDGTVMPGDAQVDEANRPFVVEAEKAYLERLKFRRTVVIRDGESITHLVQNGHSFSNSLDVRAPYLLNDKNDRLTIALAAENALRQFVGGLKDLSLIDKDDANASLVTDESAAQHYTITYNLTEFNLKGEEFKDYQRPNYMIAFRAIASVTANVKMVAPDGKVVFDFSATGYEPRLLRYNPPIYVRSNHNDIPQDIFRAAAANAINAAMAQYATKFAPPLYVTATCQDGRFACLNSGSQHGLLPGTRIEFYRHASSQGPDGQPQLSLLPVGTGTVGARNAPVGPEQAWVFVDNVDPEKRPRTVFQWTSARVLAAPTSQEPHSVLGGLTEIMPVPAILIQ